MTKCVLAALAITAMAPVAAQGGTVVTAARPESVGGFSLPALLDGVDRVLASVDNGQPAQPDPFGGEAVVFTDIALHRTDPAPRVRAAYSSGDVAVTEPLPETTTWLMMILGFFGLSFAVRRRTSVSTGDRVRFS